MRAKSFALGAAVLVAVASPAFAADFVPGTNIIGPPSANFTVSGNPFSGPVSAAFGRSGLVGSVATPFVDTDRFLFTLGQNGQGSGVIQSVLAGQLGGSTDTDLLNVTFWNGSTLFNVPIIGSFAEFGQLINVPISTGVLNILSITYRSRGDGNYSGNLSFVPNAAVPEPGTWALLLLGFAAMGFALRSRPKQKLRVNYSF